MQGLRRQPGRVGWVEALALTLVALVQAGVCAWTPLMVSPDGLDYLSGAITLARGDGLHDVVSYKAPGLTFVLAGVLWFSGGGIELLHGVQAGIGVVTAVLVWLTLRRFGRWRALAGGVVVGLHPVLLVYQGYLLRESLAAFLLAVLAWLLVVAADRGREIEPQRAQRTGESGLGRRAGVLGLSGLSLGALALLRENGLVTLVAMPLLLVWLCRGKETLAKTLVSGGLVLVIALVCVLPWAWHVKRDTGYLGVTAPKTQFNRAVNAWWNGMLDGTEVPGSGRGTSDYEFIARALVREGIVKDEGKPAADIVVEAMTSRAGDVEAVCRALVETAIAREPSKLWKDRGVAFVGLMGLWDLGKHPAARADGYNALPLRGRSKWGTNFLFDVESVLRTSRFSAREAELREVLGRSQEDIAFLKGGQGGRVFDGWWRGFEVIRYVVGWAFFVGLGVAVWRRERAIAALAAIVLLNLGGAAWVVMSATDRVAAPFIPLMVIVAAYGVAELVRQMISKSRASHV